MPSLIYFVPFALIVLLAIARGFNPVTSQQKEVYRNDRQLVAFAEALDGLNDEQRFYIHSMGDQLLSYNRGYANNAFLDQVFAFATLSAAYISVGITGSGYIECNTAKSLAFTINLLAALSAGLAQLFLFSKNSQNNLTAASRLRWEFWQFVGSSQEYSELAIGGRYSEFTRQTDNLIADDLSTQQSLHSAAKDSKDKAKKAADDLHKSEEGRQ